MKLAAFAAIGTASLLSIATHLNAATDKPTEKAIVFAVSTKGDDTAAGSPEAPFLTLERAQRAVRTANAEHDVTVMISEGTYSLSQPLIFTAEDGGQNGHHVLWQAAAGTHVVLSGAKRISNWKLYNKERDIYVADTPIGLDARQLWVNNSLAQRASMEIPRTDVQFTREGILLNDAAYQQVAQLADSEHAEPAHMEIVATGFFTKRISPVERIEGHTLLLKQPAWKNNIWGYDTVTKPFGPEFAKLYLSNSLSLLREPGQWYLDPSHGKLYLRPPTGVAINDADVELPRLTTLLAVGNSLDEPVHDLGFQGIQFSYTSWNTPSTAEGFASQQSGSYLRGEAVAYPADALTSCAQGCPAFETVRNEWYQIPASIQVAAARMITFDGDLFVHLGQYALGIGNDSNANVTGAGLGTSDITVTQCLFADNAGGAILAGGVRRDAHHPHDPRMINRALLISNNRIQSVSKEYVDQSAILSTYVEAALIVHNDISDLPYDAIDIGYGWGYEDAGGNANYRRNQHGYDFKDNLVYDTPTTHHDVVVAYNRIHGAKQIFHDGGAIYNLSASPRTLITENYIYDNNGRIALYLDEGSRYITVRKNVVDDPGGTWLNINTAHSAYPFRITVDNTASGNWHNGTKVGGMWTNYENDLIVEDHPVTGADWPDAAKETIKAAGIEPSAHTPQYR